MTNILVVIDPGEDKHSALERCRQISPAADLVLHVFLFIPSDSARDLAQVMSKKKAWLEDVVENLQADGYVVRTAVKTFARLHEAIIRAAESIRADLVFKPMRQHSLARQVVLTSTDWNLIRFCPQPLLLVNGDQEFADGNVLAAVDVLDDEPAHADLNNVVMEQAVRVAAVLNSKVICVNAWSINAAVMSGGSLEPLPVEVMKSKRAHHLEATRELATSYGCDPQDVVVEEGRPSFVINEAAKSKQAGVVVIGTVARTGVSGLFVGNTAEDILDGSQSDVLVVKQAGFKCPF